MNLEFKNQNGKVKKVVLLDSVNRIAVLQIENSKKQKRFITVDAFNAEKETWRNSDTFDELHEAALFYYKKIREANKNKLVSKIIQQRKEEIITNIRVQIANRENTHYGLYHDVGTVLDNYSTFELYVFFTKVFGEGAARYYFENQIIANEINKERYK